MRKKLLTLFVSLLVLASFSGCQQTEVINPNRTVLIDINRNDWIPNNNGTVWTVNLNMPEINSYIYEVGMVRADISFENNVYSPLTDVYFNGVAYRMDYGVGYITLDAFYADGYGEPLGQPGPCRLKVVISESN